MAKLHGYSERGVVNAVFDELVYRGEIRIIKDFLGLIVKWCDGMPIQLPEYDDVDVFIEPSLSDFGDPDVLLILRKKGKDVLALFIEAKVETFVQSTQKAKQTGKSGVDYGANYSSVLHELFLKIRFWNRLDHVDALVQGRPVYRRASSDDKKPVSPNKRDRPRRIGDEAMVLGLADRLRTIACSNSGGHKATDFESVYFVSLTTDRVKKKVKPTDWPDVKAHLKKIMETNQYPGEFDKINSRFGLLSWYSIYQLTDKYAQGSKPQLKRIGRELRRNQTKFTFPGETCKTGYLGAAERGTAARLLEDALRPLAVAPGNSHFTVTHENPQQKSTVFVGGRAIFKVAVIQGFTDTVLELYAVQKEVQDQLSKELRPLFIRITSSILEALAGNYPSSNLDDEDYQELLSILEMHIQLVPNLKPAPKNARNSGN